MATDIPGNTCPICGGAVMVPPLDDLVLRLINDHGLSEEAEGFLRLLWRGEIVPTAVLLASLYEDDPTAEPPLNRLYQEAWTVLTELRAALKAEGSGADVIDAGYRIGFRLQLRAANHNDIGE